MIDSVRALLILLLICTSTSAIRPPAWTTKPKPPHARSITPISIHAALHPTSTQAFCPPDSIKCGRLGCINIATTQCCPETQNACPLGESCIVRLHDERKEYDCAKRQDSARSPLSMVKHDSIANREAGTATGAWTHSKRLVHAPPTPLPTSPMGIPPKQPQPEMSVVPIRNTGTQSRIPKVFTAVVLLLRSARGVTLPSPVFKSCCSDVCCAEGEVCTRTAEGAKCWPQAQTLKSAADDEAEEDVKTQIINARESMQVEGAWTEDGGDTVFQEKKGGGVAAGGGGRAPHVGGGSGGHKNGSSRPRIPAVVLLLLVFTSTAVAIIPIRLPSRESHIVVSAVAQTSPGQPTYDASLTKRWSCHEPKKNCGDGDCFQPGVYACCKKPDDGQSRGYGLCMAEKGESCCGSMCCPKDTKCAAEEEYLCVPEDANIRKQ